MTRKNTDIIDAFLNKRSLKGSSLQSTGDELLLFGNRIAKRENGVIFISNAGWTTATTKKYLNELLGRIKKPYIYLHKGEWHWNYEEFPTDEWVSVYGETDFVNELISDINLF